MSLAQEVNALANGYVRKGGKKNRQQQRARMITFANYAVAMGAHSMAQVGKYHVIGYWKANRALADSTLYNHWRALCVLWVRAGKVGQPPKPRFAKDESATQKSDAICSLKSP